MRDSLWGQRGSTTVLAVVAMVFLGIVIAGLLPMLTMELKSAATDREALQAQYAAEAGVKRALMGLDEDDTGWAWLTPPPPAAPNWRNLANDGKATYYVLTGPHITDGSKPQKKTTYTITATGKAGGVTKSATASYTTKGGGPTGTNWAGGDANPPPPLSAPLPSQASYNAANGLIINSGTVITGGTIATGANPSQVVNNTSIAVQTNVTQPLPDVPVSLNHNDYKNGSQTLGNTPGAGNYALAGAYYSDRDFIVNSGVNLSATGGRSADAVIFAKGDMIINGNLTTNATTNIILIADRNIILNSGATITGNIQIYAQHDIIIQRSISGYALIMGRRDVIINSGVTLNKAVVSADNDLTINAGTTITGQIMAGHRLILNGCTINLDPFVI